MNKIFASSGNAGTDVFEAVYQGESTNKYNNEELCKVVRYAQTGKDEFHFWAEIEYVASDNPAKNLLAIAMVIIVLIVGVFGIKSLVSPGYMRPIKLVEKGFNDCDAEPIYESLSPETKKVLEMSGCKNIIENLQSAIEEYSDGKDVNVSNIKTDIIVGNKKKLDKEELSQTLVDQYMVSQEEAEKASAAYIVDGNIVFKSGNSVVKEISTQFVVAKINMKWYLVYLQ